MNTGSNKMDSAEVFNMFETLKGLLVKKEEKSVEQVNPLVSKEEIEKIVLEKISVMATFIDLKIKQQTENQTKILTTAINGVDKKIENLSVSQVISYPQPKKIAFFGFEFLRTSVVIFILSVAMFWSFVMNIKQMDNYSELKTQYNQLTESVNQLQKTGKTEKGKENKVK